MARGSRRELPEAVTFALHGEAIYQTRDVQTGLNGWRFRVDTPDGTLEVRSPLRGEVQRLQRDRRDRRRSYARCRAADLCGGHSHCRSGPGSV